MTIPFIDDITILSDTWSYPDWLANDTGTFAEIANAIGAALALLGISFSVQTHTAAGSISITSSGFHFIRKTVPAATTVTLDQGIVGPVGVFSDAFSDQYPVTIQVASGGTIVGQSALYLASPGRGVQLIWIGSGEYGITAFV